MNGPIMVAAAIVFVLASAPRLGADLTRAKAEPNLERRARLALDNASLQFRAAVNADKTGDWGGTKQALAELSESVDLAYESLKATSRNPRNSGHHKNFEIKTRGLLKSLEDFRRRLDFEQREQLEPLVEHIQKLHDEVLQSILEPKRR